MHEPLTERFEEYLQSAKPIPEVEAHLANCEACRNEVAEMKKQANLLRSLRPPAEVEPSPGFYARVLNRMELQSGQSVWAVFVESIFAKRLAFASLAFCVLVGTYLVSSTNAEKQPYTASAPEVIIANDDHIHPQLNNDIQQDRDQVLVNLASYQQ